MKKIIFGLSIVLLSKLAFAGVTCPTLNDLKKAPIKTTVEIPMLVNPNGDKIWMLISDNFTVGGNSWNAYHSFAPGKTREDAIKNSMARIDAKQFKNPTLTTVNSLNACTYPAVTGIDKIEAFNPPKTIAGPTPV